MDRPSIRGIAQIIRVADRRPALPQANFIRQDRSQLSVIQSSLSGYRLEHIISARETRLTATGLIGRFSCSWPSDQLQRECGD
ncbi:hypothetical protein R5H32_19010 [Defluviimonas sp. D31]|nr:hypothetical protein [Defluviimonas sp. D31]